jgi:hypothetical protein
VKRIPLRWVLPLLNLALAPALVWWGEFQRAMFMARIEADADIFGITPHIAHTNYVPVGTQLCTALNAPAQLGAAAITDAPDNALFYRATFLALVFFVWWLTGRRLDGVPFAAHGPERLAFAMVELAFGAVLLAGTMVTNWGPTPVAHAGASAWALFMMASAFARMRSTPAQTAVPANVPPPPRPAAVVSVAPEDLSASLASNPKPKTTNVVPELPKAETEPAEREPGENLK